MIKEFDDLMASFTGPATDLLTALAGAIQHAMERSALQIDALQAQLAARDAVLRRLVGDGPDPQDCYEQSGCHWDGTESEPECLHCNGDAVKHPTSGCYIIVHTDDCPILVGQKLLASAEAAHE